MKKNSIIHNSLFIILFMAAFLERTVWDLGPNVELVTAATILSAYYLGVKKTFWLTLMIMALSDRVIGNTSIFLFTWSGFLIPALLASNTFKKFSDLRRHRLVLRLFSSLGLGLGSNLFFFIWTNFGVWLLDSWGMYPKTSTGLIMSYINGLPFLKPQLISSLIFIPLGFFIIEIARKFVGNHTFSFNRSAASKI